jgi:hypothetical protein
MPFNDPKRRKEWFRSYYERNREKFLERSRRYRKKNREKCSTYNRRYCSGIKFRIKRLEAKYNVDYEYLCKLHVLQGMACGICGTPIPPPPSRKAQVDHCHDTGKIRGILCSSCNAGLGFYERFQKLGIVDRVNNYLSKGT